MARKNQSSLSQSEERDAELIKVVQAYRSESEEARLNRLRLNKRNWEMYYGQQDWSYKQEGQSTESLPKVASAVEQFSAFIKRALTQFGNWFSVDVPKNSPLDAAQARSLMKHYLEDILISPSKCQSFATIIQNAIKAGLLESLIVIKIHGHKIEEPTFSADGKSLKRGTRKVWKPRVDIIPSEDYYPDPTGRGLYEVHRVERDLIDLQMMAEQGIYDKDVVSKITADVSRDTDKDARRPAQRNQNESTPPAFRKRVVIDECWGTILGRDGEVLQQNGVCAIANDKYVIRRPEPNPFWHGRSPILAIPLIQVPFSVWGRALYDQAASINMALNELFNLMLDGGIAQVWGVRQVRVDWLADPRQISGGIPQNATLAINSDVPIDGKVVEAVTEGQVPREALEMFNMADREFQAASLVNDVRLGNLAQRNVKATEIVEASNNSSTMVDSLASDIEREFITPALEILFMNLMQFADDLAADAIVETIGVDAAFKLAQMTAAQRFALFASSSKFKAYGLSATLSKARDFQKMMAIMQAIGTNPILMQAFMARFSPDKAIDAIFKSINIDPDVLLNSPEEQAQAEQRMQQVMQLQQAMGGRQQEASPQAGMAGERSEIAQNANPTGGVPNM